MYKQYKFSSYNQLSGELLSIRGRPFRTLIHFRSKGMRGDKYLSLK